jgi:hypothetical protein
VHCAFELGPTMCCTSNYVYRRNNNSRVVPLFSLDPPTECEALFAGQDDFAMASANV